MTAHATCSAMTLSPTLERRNDRNKDRPAAGGRPPPAPASGCLLVSFMDDCAGSPEQVLERAAAHPELAVVVYAEKTEISVHDAIEIMRAGAFDIILEPIAPHALRARLEAAAEEGRRRRERHAAQAAARGRLERLTPREREVANVLVEGASNKLAARRLALSPRTVEFYRARIFDKLEIGNVAELARVTFTARA